jgi:glycerophosphoryl diester phosphodiesterase
MTGWRTLDGRPPRIIAHRGASGLFPEHSRPAFERAIADGADVLEPDLMPSADGVLFARHDAWLSRSTDIASRSEFVDRKEAGIDGRIDWWCDRFTAAELRSLHARQRYAERDPSFDGVYPLLDLESLLDIAATAGLPTYPEIKHPRWFRERGIDVTALLIEVLQRRGLRGREAPVWVQSFDFEALATVHEALALDVFPLVRFEPSVRPDALQRTRAATHEFAAGMALDKRLLATVDAAVWIDGMHGQGASVHIWTFRDDKLTPGLGDPVMELKHFLALGADAVFCDFPATGVRARDELGRELTSGA